MMNMEYLIKHAMQVPGELESFLELIKAVGAKRVVEIGTNSGFTAAAIATIVNDVTTVDIAEYHPYPFETEEYKKEYPNASVYFIKGNSLTFNIADHIRSRMNGELYDVIFVDGEHNDLSGYMDVKNYGNMTKILALHDIHDWQTLRDSDWMPRTLWRMLREDGSFDLEDIVAKDSTGGIGVIYMKEGDYAKIVKMFEKYLLQKLA